MMFRSITRGAASRFRVARIGHSERRFEHRILNIEGRMLKWGRVFDLDVRLMDLAVSIGRIVKRLTGVCLGSHVARQLVRSGTSPAANYAEALGAEPRRDFVHKLRLSRKELRETLVWLRFAERMHLAHGIDNHAVEVECNELVSIFIRLSLASEFSPRTRQSRCQALPAPAVPSRSRWQTRWSCRT